MKTRIHAPLRRAKLPPILEIDEDGVPVAEMGFFEPRRWSSDGEEPGVTLAEWPAEFDD
jgi:hypothetical protein